MIHLDIEQGSKAWHQARLGIPTTSCFDKIVTKTGKPSAQSTGYAHRLIAETMLGYPLDEVQTVWMERGVELEPDALAYYELQHDTETTNGGFVTTDDGKVGCSPDRLVGDDGLLEIKCPAPQTHVGYLLGGGAADRYRYQVQGQLWVCERRWVDVLSYHPDLPPAMVRVERDEPYIEALAKHVRAFCVGLEEMREKLEGRSI